MTHVHNYSCPSHTLAKASCVQYTML